VQQQMQLACWEAVIRAIRAGYEQELERLRDENRTLKVMFADMMEADAKAA
jgi:demethoxyubiquinone hydroxylase (CLK1/Coq7/Cat5 family)